MKRTTLLFFLLSIIISSCCVDDCEVDPEDCNPNLVEFSEFQELAQSLEITQFQKTSSGAVPIIVFDMVPFDTYQFELAFLFQTFAFDQPNGQGNFIEINEPQFCKPSGLGFVEKIVDVQIQALTNYNDNIKAGDSLNGLITLNEDLSLNDYLAMDLADRAINFNYIYNLNEKPSAEKIRYSVDVILDSGTQFSVESPEITFL